MAGSLGNPLSEYLRQRREAEERGRRGGTGLKEYKDLSHFPRVLMGPGPSDVHPRVLRALSTPLLGHLDPDFLQIMNENMELLRYVFRTENELTIAISGTGSAGMETCLVNLIEPGDRVLVCINGVFGTRMADIVERCGGELVRLEAEWGRIIEPSAVEKVLKEKGPFQLVCVVHAETSTGALSPIEEIAPIVHEHGALFLVDAVTSLGGVPVEVDQWQIDAIYSGTQKCLSCPPGLAPVSFGPRARAKLNSRRTKVQSWYLDLTMIQNYWGSERFYHHTAPISMVYALREALRLIYEEGLDAVHRRHRENSQLLVEGLQEMGLQLFAQEGYRTPMLTTVHIPEGIDDVTVRQQLLQRYGIEIGGGIGPVKGKIWRIGLMGFACNRRNVELLLAALGRILREQGYRKA